VICCASNHSSRPRRSGLFEVGSSIGALSSDFGKRRFSFDESGLGAKRAIVDSPSR
jgi:hypothetical protein